VLALNKAQAPPNLLPSQPRECICHIHAHHRSDTASSTVPSSSAASQSTTSAASQSTAVGFTSANTVATATTALSVTTTDASGHTVTTAPSLITQAVTSTNAQGQVYTVTQIVHNPTASGSSSSASSGSGSFFNNSGAVAAIFVVVGLGITAGVIAFIFFMLRRRRRQRLDRDVAAAAAAAAAAAHHSRSNFDEDEEHPAMTQYGGYYAATTPGIELNGEPQPNIGGYDYEDPAGGYDPYAANLAAGDRMSTATAPGLAGFGAQSAQANYAAPSTDYDSHGYETLAQPEHNASPNSQGKAPAQQGYFFDPKQAYDYAEEDAYGGYDEEHQPPGHYRAGSEGSVAARGGERRGLKVTNV